LKWRVFTKDNVKYDFENQKFGVLRTGYGPNAVKRTKKIFLKNLNRQIAFKNMIFRSWKNFFF
jgi:hypothetical protein